MGCSFLLFFLFLLFSWLFGQVTVLISFGSEFFCFSFPIFFSFFFVDKTKHVHFDWNKSTDYLAPMHFKVWRRKKKPIDKYCVKTWTTFGYSLIDDNIFKAVHYIEHYYHYYHNFVPPSTSVHPSTNVFFSTDYLCAPVSEIGYWIKMKSVNTNIHMEYKSWCDQLNQNHFKEINKNKKKTTNIGIFWQCKIENIL